MQESKLLSVECHSSTEVVEIHLNRSGLDCLIEVLESLRKANSLDHVHLMSPEWGGNELTGQSCRSSTDWAAAKHLKVCLW